MNPARISKICQHVGCVLSQEQLDAAIQMCNKEAEAYIRSMPPIRELALQRVAGGRDLTCVPGSMWEDDELPKIANDRGISLRSLKYLRDECRRLELERSMAVNDGRVKEDILQEVSRIDKKATASAVAVVRSRHHQGQGYLFAV